MLPLLNDKLPVAKLPQRTGLLTFVQGRNTTYGLLAIGNKVEMWQIPGSGQLASKVGQLLREIGVGKNRGARLSDDQAWRTAALALRRILIPEDNQFAAENLDELIIVPDGVLWYVPFDILPIAEKSSALIGDQIAIRYAATPGLALQHTKPPSTSGAIGIVAAPFFAPKDAELNRSIVDSITELIQDPVELPETGGLPSGWLGPSIEHFVVAAPLIANPKNQLMMSVSPYDHSSPYGTLAGWMGFPAVVPRSAVLIGLRTPIDGGKMGTGDEIFVTICALRAAGVENILLSRWAVGGESTAVLLRELLQELPYAGMNNAWQRAKMVLRRSELDPEGEPLLTKADRQRQALTGEEPLFWSGYVVSTPTLAEPPPDAPASVSAE